MTELIISEKPAAAQKIAEAISDGKPIKKNNSGIPYYEVTRKGKKILVGCAVGHLYGLDSKTDNKWGYPIFDIEWKESSKVKKSSEFSKKYLDSLKKLSKDADEITVATDYDVEGEVIGLNIVRYACKKKDANRMKFSTLTKDDLVEAYENKSKHIDWGQAEAGETRHKLDWFYGINLSRALSDSIKSGGLFKILSIGRVQGPALKLIVDKEKEIQSFKPVPYWQIELIGEKDKQVLDSFHEKDKFSDKSEVDKIYNSIKNEKKAEIKSVETTETKQPPPNPFDLTSLQLEAHKTMGIPPKETLDIAQDLYTNGYISYPRTSSQQLTPKIGFAKILTLLSKQDAFTKECKKLLSKKNLTPNDGKKTDPAHPAIYPTGIAPNALKDKRTEGLYELIVRRFLATFGEPAVRETMTVTIDCKKENFIAKGTRTKIKGWHEEYGRFVMLKEEELPKVNVKDILNVKKIELLTKETQPPKRYTEASIIKELEKRNLGTKATRATIIETLFHRNYVKGKALEATELGIKTSDTLEKYSPKILDEQLTRGFEEDMEEIRELKKHEPEILENAKKILLDILTDFKENKLKIGAELASAEKNTKQIESIIGVCPLCKQGDLLIKRGKFGRFAACSRYPDCKLTNKLPATGKIQPSEKVCEQCNNKLVKIIDKKRFQEVCLNPFCPSKTATKKEEKEYSNKKCPKCGGNLIIRSSVYGKFLGCSNYPKCRHTEPIAEAV